MRGWTKTIGLLFLSIGSAYSGQAIAGHPGSGSVSAKGDNTTSSNVLVYDPAAAPATAPAIAPVVAPPAHDTLAPSAGDVQAAMNILDAAAPSTMPAESAPMVVSDPSDAAGAHSGKSVSQAQVSVKKDSGTVEIHVNNADLVELLRMLSMQSETNILPSKDVHGTVTANLYDVTIREALDAILHANGYAYREQGNVIYVYTDKEIVAMAKAERHTTTEVFHLYYTPAVNAQTMIKPVLSTEGQVAVTTPPLTGIAASATETGGNMHAVEDLMVVTDYPENLEKVRQILKEVDRRPQQILVEATILSASLTEDNSLGVDFTLLGGVNFSGLTSAGSSTGDALSGTILNNPTAGKVVNSGMNGVGTGFTQNVPTGGLQAGIITNNVAVFVSALEEITDTVVLANPKVLVLNKQKGEVKVAREDPYRGTTTVNQNGLSQQEVDFLETGTSLIFRPFIADDGYIRMEVHPEDSSPLPARSSDLPPTKLTTETTTNVMVKDGHTIVIGGMFRETAQSTKSQVPFLGNIPFLGNLFKSQSDSTTREEVIILLTPHIIKDDLAYSALSEKEAREAERLRAGVRQGMMPIGRERLAETYYQQAVTEMAKPAPDRQKALWELNCALNLSPLFTEAIDMKAKLTGQEMRASDNSTIRDFVTRSILRDRELVEPVRPSTMPINGVRPNSADGSRNVAAIALSPRVAIAPATAPTTAPSGVAMVGVKAPTTEPIANMPMSVAAPTTLPLPPTQVSPQMAEDMHTAPLAAGSVAGPATAPAGPAVLTTQQASGKSVTPVETSVTELPLEEVPAEAPKSGK